MTLTRHDFLRAPTSHTPRFPASQSHQFALCWPRVEVDPLMTPATLQTISQKDLAQMAKQGGVRGWHSMRKDQLIRALVSAARSSGLKRSTSKKIALPARRSQPAKAGRNGSA